MVALASQCGFRDRAWQCVSAPAKPGNVDGSGFSESMGRNGGLSERSEPAPGAESAPPLFRVQGNRACQARAEGIPAITVEALNCGGFTTH